MKFFYRAKKQQWILHLLNFLLFTQNIHLSWDKNIIQVFIAMENHEIDWYSDFHFWAPPHPKSYCFAQLYIEPIACRNWEHNLVPPFSGTEVEWMIPQSYLDPLYDYRIWSSQRLGTVYAVKRGTFFISLEYLKHSNQHDPRKKKVYGSKFGALVGYLWTHPSSQTLRNSVKPTILSFNWDGYSLYVKETLKITCIGYQFWTSALLGFPNKVPTYLLHNPKRL